MPATFAPITTEVLAGLRQGDERTLERFFREHYDVLLEEAQASMDEAAFASRVVEGAILRMWDKREGFETPSALETFLHSAVHEGAVREKSRRAALHRFEAHEGVKVERNAGPAVSTVDEAWLHIHTLLHPPPVDPKHAAQLHDASRHHAAAHMASVAKHHSPWITIGYAAAALIVVSGVMFAIFRETPSAKVTRFLKSTEAREIVSKYGQIGNVELDDGTKVTLGADSRLLIPPGFASPEGVRGVRVTGTASFDVATREGQPFEVRLGEVAVVATGTRFAVNFDTATSAALVRVDDGTVELRAGEVVRPLAAGSAMAVDAALAMSDADAGMVDAALAWTAGRLVVVDRPLREALEHTRRWYAIALIPNDMSLMDRTVSINAPLDSSKKMIADLEASGNMKFGWEENTMVLYDASAVKGGGASKQR